jgi:tetratricopeptide (TPR) repeat protein
MRWWRIPMCCRTPSWRKLFSPTAQELARSPAFHFQRGTDLYGKGQLAEAIAAYRQCIALQADYPHARYNLGVALGDAEAYDEAIAHLQQVLQAEPERAEAYNSLGYLWSRQRHPEQAVACYEQAIMLQPNYAQAHCNLGLTLLQMGGDNPLVSDHAAVSADLSRRVGRRAAAGGSSASTDRST